MASDRSGIELTAPRPGTWLNRGEHTIYDCPWVRLAIADVLLPDGTQVDHHLVRMPRPAAGTIVVADGAVLLLHRHRFITDSWGWEIPAGVVDPGEQIEHAAIREALEESGWEPLSVRHLCRFFPANGLVDQEFHIFVSDDAVHRGEPTDRNEAASLEWHPIASLAEMLTTGAIADGLSFGAISFALATGALH